jgi:hypothetical protein
MFGYFYKFSKKIENLCTWIVFDLNIAKLLILVHELKKETWIIKKIMFPDIFNTKSGSQTLFIF